MSSLAVIHFVFIHDYTALRKAFHAIKIVVPTISITWASSRSRVAFFLSLPIRKLNGQQHVDFVTAVSRSSSQYRFGLHSTS